ncbi:MAG: AAA family ATPase [Anaerobiospirillum succiniciproducens]|uniref:AAA family ATPase n=1 Tax=Anaerobiospirillum succiniciproducens TaxID=13335 RepID=UPI002A75B884|nr:AAA family ATPase [Anaerobiospirillum succiniciproducens]MDY2797940.1 AAA family ATPase [Anaerobiospirillum succiniciproducens]
MVQRKISSGSFASFKEFITGDMVYVDKTAPLCTLAREQGSFLLARPRRMGKSTLVSTLEYLFSKGTVGTEGLACHTQWDDPNRYFVFKFSWNNIRPLSADELERGLLWQLNTYANYFGLELPSNVGLMQQANYLFTQSLDKLSDQQFMQEHTELFNGDRPLCKTKAVLLIDEYDAPLTYSIENGKSVDDLLRVYANFFSTIKEMDFRFVLITGVSSYAQTSIFSGANQFANISLQYKYATCCGFTHDELEHYFDKELSHAEQVLNLSHAELMERLSLSYDGYLFSNNSLCQTRVFSPVSVTSFLKMPEIGFENYWVDTGAKSTFLLKLLKCCSIGIMKNLSKVLYGDVNNEQHTLSSSVQDYLASLYVVFNASICAQEKYLDKSRLIEVLLGDLTVELENFDDLSFENAIAVLFQSGYLSIRQIESGKAWLGFANYEVSSTLAELIYKHGFSNNALSGLRDVYAYLFKNYQEVFKSFYQGGSAVAALIDLILSPAPWELFADNNYENVVSFVIVNALQYSGVKAAREVSSAFGRMDFVIYKQNSDPLVMDVIVEFKLARKGESIDRKLKLGCEQIVQKSYGGDLFNANPLRYCIVISNELRKVGGVARVDEHKKTIIEYRADKLGDDGKVFLAASQQST